MKEELFPSSTMSLSTFTDESVVIQGETVRTLCSNDWDTGVQVI